MSVTRAGGYSVRHKPEMWQDVGALPDWGRVGWMGDTLAYGYLYGTNVKLETII